VPVASAITKLPMDVELGTLDTVDPGFGRYDFDIHLMTASGSLTTLADPGIWSTFNVRFVAQYVTVLPKPRGAKFFQSRPANVEIVLSNRGGLPTVNWRVSARASRSKQTRVFIVRIQN